VTVFDRLSNWAGFIDRLGQSEISREFVDRLRIRCPGDSVGVSTLSGGNQQKIVLAKWLARKCRVILLDEPTRGIDVGAKFAGKVAFHYACHSRMLGLASVPGGGLRSEVETLVRNVAGATYVPLNRQEQCCGFGVSFAIRYPQISGNMVEDKMQCILASGADCVVSTDAGCLMNIGGRLHRAGQRVELLHIAELLDRR
jgi:Fe-S oxidoreductase